MTPVVIFAGGLGLRLHPLTKDRPKPLLPVGSKSILQTIIEGFRDQGFRRFTLCLGYKAEMIEGHFRDGAELGVKLRYLLEDQPLGTGGALRLIQPAPDKPFIVSNADILFSPPVSYGHLMEAHARANAMITVCGALHQHQVPFGVLDLAEDGRIAGIREKPIENFTVNAGLYVLEPEVLNYLPAGAFDLPDILPRLPTTGAKAGVALYPHEGQWHDVGHVDAIARQHYTRTLGGL